jgi:Transposase DDE domain
LAISDNRGNIIAPLVVCPVNHHDNILFNESFFGLMGTADLLELDLAGSYLTLDSGFDSDANKTTITGQGLIPVIHPNIRNLKDREKIDALWEAFEPYRAIYKERYRIERMFAWEDVYRRLVIRYERLQATHRGFKYLAYSMINLRWCMGKR